jgi:F-type H+-transporting ATPase subunit delta
MASKGSRNAPVVARYARALLQLANERQQAEAVRADLNGLREVFEANPDLARLLADPAVSEAKRGELLRRVFAGRLAPTLMNFLGVLNAKGRLGLLPDMIEAFNDLLEEQLGNVEVDVTVAQRLDAGQLEQVRQRVSQALGRAAVVHQYVDESIIGGLVLRVQDKLIDASVRFQLDQMRRRLLQAVPK